MRKMIIFLCMVMMSALVYAQAPSHLKGPAAKHYKSWKHQGDKAGSKLLVHTNKPQLTGPEAKNQNKLSNQADRTFTVVKLADRPKYLRGPNYKNNKPWQRTKNQNMDVVDDLPGDQPKQGGAASGNDN